MRPAFLEQHQERLHATITGTNSNDNLRGTTGNDLLYGLAGNDTINALAGADEMHGGEGNDSLYADRSIHMMAVPDSTPSMPRGPRASRSISAPAASSGSWLWEAEAMC